MRATVGIIGDAIKEASKYLPIRNRAVALASLAPPKDYFAQLQSIFDDTVKRWRYVRDPVGRELVTRSPQQIFHLVLGGRSTDPGVGLGYGAGDCDDIAIGIGSLCLAAGFPVRVKTIAPQGAPPGRLMSHVFVEAEVPGHGWVTVDPVVYPKNGLGYMPPNSRYATYDLNGRFLGGGGNLTKMSGMAGIDTTEGATQMNLGQMEDMSLEGIDCGYGNEEPLDFRQHGIKDWGLYSETLGIMDLGDYGMGLVAEVDTDETGLVWTPMLEMAPSDIEYIREKGTPYNGMLALGDNLEVYTYDGTLGFFKKLFKKAKKAARAVARKAKKMAKKVLKKLPGGKYLLKLGAKLWKISKKLVGPLAKFVGKYAAKLAPIAALIPGYGPAIAGALHMTGKIAKTMNKFGIKVAKKKGDPVGKIKAPSDVAMKQFEAEIKKAAAAAKRKGKGRIDKKPHRSDVRGKKAILAKKRPGRVGTRARRAIQGGRRPASRARSGAAYQGY